jgi:hypothetical protein
MAETNQVLNAQTSGTLEIEVNKGHCGGLQGHTHRDSRRRQSFDQFQALVVGSHFQQYDAVDHLAADDFLQRSAP